MKGNSHPIHIYLSVSLVHDHYPDIFLKLYSGCTHTAKDQVDVGLTLIGTTEVHRAESVISFYNSFQLVPKKDYTLQLFVDRKKGCKFSIEFNTYDILKSGLHKQSFVDEKGNCVSIIVDKSCVEDYDAKYVFDFSQPKETLKYVMDIMMSLPDYVTVPSKLVKMRCSASNLICADHRAKSDPYFTITKKIMIDGKLEEVILYRSDPEENTLNPVWREFYIDFNKIGSMNQALYFYVKDRDKYSNDDLIGSFTVDLETLETGTDSFPFSIKGEAKRKLFSKKKKNDGVFLLHSYAIIEAGDESLNQEKEYLKRIAQRLRREISEEIYNMPESDVNELFEKYIENHHLNLMFGIDFTNSNIFSINKRPCNLHNMDVYERVIRYIGNQFGPYIESCKKHYPVFGYGARIYNEEGGYDCPDLCDLSLETGIEVPGIEGVIDSYRAFVSTSKLGDMRNSRPYFPDTDFRKNDIYHLIHHCAYKSGTLGTDYTVLVLICSTLSRINLEKTIDALIKADNRPFSIILVGLTNKAHRNGHLMDADDKQLYSSNDVERVRDVVNYVSFDPFDPNATLDGAMEELPIQVVTYYKLTLSDE